MKCSNNILLTLLVCLFCLGHNTSIHAQFSIGGTPKSFISDVVDESLVMEYLYDKPEIEALLEEDFERDNHGLNLRDAVAIPVSLNSQQHGTWFDLGNGDRIWRLQVKVPEALSLEACFQELFLPSGSELFIYNASGDEVHGAYTFRNNRPSGRISTEMVTGDVINLEYYEPGAVEGEGVISLLDLGYRYRDVIGITDPDSNGASSCHVDIVCEEGATWSSQAKSVLRVRTRVNGQFFWSTGVLMNNTLNDCRPLVLTSLRSALDGGNQASTSDLDMYRFYFGYKSSQCHGPIDATMTKSISGCVRLADSNDDGGISGSDFLLLELSNDVPQSYEPYYAGWNAMPMIGEGGGVSIHHPSGDAKKVSTYLAAPVNAQWGQPNTHLSVTWSGTENGHGVMQNGSYGAPLFNADGRVIGTFSGGTSFCDEDFPGGQDQPDLFGKLSHHWSSNPNPSSEKLSFFLDPINGALQNYQGAAEPCQITSIGEFETRGMKIMPNPGKGQFRITLRQPVENAIVEVLDMSGRTVFEESFGWREKILYLDIAYLNSGSYLIRIKDGASEVYIDRLQLSK